MTKRTAAAGVLLALGLILGGCVKGGVGEPGTDHGKTSKEEKPTRVPPKGAGPISGCRVFGSVLASPAPVTCAPAGPPSGTTRISLSNGSDR
ncbi:MAG: hypothetical protein ACRDN9_10010 [Streptosporangiaceae bacterium]